MRKMDFPVACQPSKSRVPFFFFKSSWKLATILTMVGNANVASTSDLFLHEILVIPSNIITRLFTVYRMDFTYLQLGDMG